MINKETALTLARPGVTLYHMTLRNADKTPMRCRVNGRCQVWKTRPDDFKLPVKHGLKTCFYITPANGAEWTTSEETAKGIPAPGYMQGKGAA